MIKLCGRKCAISWSQTWPYFIWSNGDSGVWKDSWRDSRKKKMQRIGSPFHRCRLRTHLFSPWGHLTAAAQLSRELSWRPDWPEGHLVGSKNRRRRRLPWPHDKTTFKASRNGGNKIWVINMGQLIGLIWGLHVQTHIWKQNRMYGYSSGQKRPPPPK